MDIRFGPGFYERDRYNSPPRELLNFYAEASGSQDDRQFVLYPTPGLSAYKDLSGTLTRGIATSIDQFNNDMFVVYDDQFKRITTAGTVGSNITVTATSANIARARITYSSLSGGTFSTGSIVTSSGSGSATVVADNGANAMSLALVTNGDFVAGQTLTQGGVTATIDSYIQDAPVSMAFSAIQEMAFTSGGRVYVYNGTTLVDVQATGGTIGDLNYVNVVYIAGRFVYIPNDDDQFWWSETLDGDNVDALNFATAERKGSNLRAGTEFGGDLWLFERDNIEIWTPTGRSDLPFQLRPGGIIDKGIIGPYAHTRVGQSLFWMSDDRVVYRAEGQGASPVSTPAISERIQGLSDANGALVTAFSYIDDGHQFVVFNVPQVGALVYDTTTGEWHERISNATLVGIGNAPGYVPWDHVWWQGAHYVASRFDAAIYKLDKTVYLEESVDGNTDYEITRQVTTHVPVRQFTPCYNFTMDGAKGVGNADDASPVVYVSWSDDQGQNYTSERSLSLGASGSTSVRITTARLGRMKPPGRVFKLRFTDKVLTALYGGRINEANP